MKNICRCTKTLIVHDAQRFLEIIGTQNIIVLQQEKSLSAFSIRSCRRARYACYSEREREGERERYNNKKRRPRRRSPLSPGTPNRCADGTRRIPLPATGTYSAVQRLQKCPTPKNARLRIAVFDTAENRPSKVGVTFCCTNTPYLQPSLPPHPS